MPTYSYRCENCNKNFELFSYIKDYQESPECTSCKKNTTHRLYTRDVLSQSASVKKSNSELKTLGDLALRNADRMSSDEKNSLYMKHNSYKFDESQKSLPSGMSRVKKPNKIKWPGASGKTKRKPKK